VIEAILKQQHNKCCLFFRRQ